MDTIRVLIVDDHPLFRSGLKVLLDSAPDTELAGEASNGLEAVRLAAECQPHVILMDVNMPGLDGIEATRRILRADPGINVLMLTMYEDDQSVFAAMRAGARGYVQKGARHEEMLRAIHAVASGEAIFSPSIAARMIDFFSASRSAVPEEAFPELTDREREVLELMARGDANAEIARSLGISIKTVRNHVSNIFSKLQVADRAQAVIRARDAGLG